MSQPSHPLYRSLLTRLERDLEILPDKPDETPRNTLACLWALAVGRPLALSQADSAVIEDIDEAAQVMLSALVERRLGGTPLAYLTGRQDFMGIVLKSSGAALVPRRETEILARAALAHIDRLGMQSPRIVDLCTGCGNLALAMAVHTPHARIWGSDLSAEAVDLARENAEFIGRTDVTFFVGDLVEPFDNDEFLGTVDVLTCNPPYISSGKVDRLHQEIADHEPRLAFDGGPFGVQIIQRLLKDAPRLLRPGGWLLFELGQGQGDGWKQRLDRLSAFDEVIPYRDENGEVRVLAASVRSGS